jgi:hypothetical protein
MSDKARVDAILRATTRDASARIGYVVNLCEPVSRARGGCCHLGAVGSRHEYVVTWSSSIVWAAEDVGVVDMVGGGGRRTEVGGGGHENCVNDGMIRSKW